MRQLQGTDWFLRMPDDFAVIGRVLWSMRSH
jgi:hypothetical protein